MKAKEKDTESIWKYMCLRPGCGMFPTPQKYCRICKSDVVEIAKKEENTDARPVNS